MSWQLLVGLGRPLGEPSKGHANIPAMHTHASQLGTSKHWVVVLIHTYRYLFGVIPLVIPIFYHSRNITSHQILG